MVRVKVCGVNNIDDAMAAAYAGADALGFIFAHSPRRVEPAVARRIISLLPPLVSAVGVFVNCHLEEVARVRDYCRLDLVQLHGDERPGEAEALGGAGRVIKALGVGPGRRIEADEYPNATLLLDAQAPGVRGGTGHTVDWAMAGEIARRRAVILAGGLTPENVARAVAEVRPFAVDACSGLEIEPGRKDHDKIASFICRAKSVG